MDVASFRQAIGRCHRIGQKWSVAVCVLACEGTHEHVALELLTKRLAADDEMDQRVLKQRRLATEEGIFGGFSAGANVHAALQLLSGAGGGVCEGGTVAVVVCDSGLKYLSTDLWE